MHIFNSDHDRALANFSPNYTPPASAVKMKSDLALLPIWYSDDDSVIAEGEKNRLFLKNIKKKLPISSEIISINSISQKQNESITPWGWNPALKKKLLNYGVAQSILPSDYELQQLRNYSNRKNAVQILKELKAEFPGICGESYFISDLNELLTYLDSFKGNKILKMPISGSGKGIIWILDKITDKQTDWCRRVIKQQGGVVAEPVLNKIIDFALEFYLDNGLVSFAGYSLFSTASSGAYTGNKLATDLEIEKELTKYIPQELLFKLRTTLKQKLSTRFPQYKGFAGVDMMICDNGLQPCVEINMRMNMGIVSRVFYDKFIDSKSKGKFIIDYFKKEGSALAFHEKMQRELPLEIKDGKITSGYLSLTPVTYDTHYIAYAFSSSFFINLLVAASE